MRVSARWPSDWGGAARSAYPRGVLLSDKDIRAEIDAAQRAHRSSTTNPWCSLRASTCGSTAFSGCSRITATRTSTRRGAGRSHPAGRAGGGRGVHPAPREFVLASTYEVISLPDDIASRLEGKSSLGRLARHPFDRRSSIRVSPDTSRWNCPIWRLCRSNCGRNEDRHALHVPAQLAGRVPVRQRAVRVALPGAARAHGFAVLPELPSDAGVSMSAVRENLTYEGFGRAVRELAQTVADDGYEPDVVLSIARGGSSSPAVSPTPWTARTSTW